MDIFASSPYIFGMTRLLVTILGILAITLVTTFASAHSARMSLSSGVDQELHLADMEHSSKIAERTCDAGQHCGSADAGMCAFVCAGLSALMPMERGDIGPARLTDDHDSVDGTNGQGLAPVLNERPPKLRLL